MSTRRNPLEKYLVREILMIDADKDIGDRLPGLLLRLAGKAGSGVKSGTATSLAEAQAYINKQTPDVVIMDPSIDSVSSVLKFIRHNRAISSQLVWVMYTHASWWHEHEESLPRRHYGKRLLSYYRMSKDLTGSRWEAEFVATLMKCHHDYVLRLLKESTEDIRHRRSGGLNREQVRKFIEKARAAIVPLSQLSAPATSSKLAFVSLNFSEASKNRYAAHIKPILEIEGYTPIMMDVEFANTPIPAAIREHIAECNLFVADLTGLRPNTLVECGAAWIKDTPMILLANRKTCPRKKLPLLLDSERFEFYDNDEQLEYKLQSAIKKAQRRKSVI